MSAMETPVQITFRDVPVSDEIERICWREAEKLERYHGRITGCHVLIAQPHRHHRKGNLYQVRLDVVIPGGEVVVDRAPPEHKSDEKVELALREAFDSARRKLEDAVRRRRGQVKTHETPFHGRVSRLDAVQGFGYLTTADGHEVYFHRNSVIGGLDELDVGTEVTFHEEEGERGPQASVVRPVGRHGHRLP
jgi:cold shock CspA family protein